MLNHKGLRFRAELETTTSAGKPVIEQPTKRHAIVIPLSR